jgi:hypothetical protein
VEDLENDVLTASIIGHSGEPIKPSLEVALEINAGN